jgi:hypothetical protein
MKLICIKENYAHWGGIFTVGSKYEGTIIEHYYYTIVTDNEKYWHHNSLSIESRHWISKGYTQETLHEVIPGYLIYSEVMRRYTIKVNIPTLRVTGDDKKIYTFSLMTKQEILNEWNVEVTKQDEIAFTTSVKMTEDYFITESQIRENKLNKLGI